MAEMDCRSEFTPGDGQTGVESSQSSESLCLRRHSADVLGFSPETTLHATGGTKITRYYYVAPTSQGYWLSKSLNNRQKPLECPLSPSCRISAVQNKCRTSFGSITCRYRLVPPKSSPLGPTNRRPNPRHPIVVILRNHPPSTHTHRGHTPPHRALAGLSLLEHCCRSHTDQWSRACQSTPTSRSRPTISIEV